MQPVHPCVIPLANVPMRTLVPNACCRMGTLMLTVRKSGKGPFRGRQPFGGTTCGATPHTVTDPLMRQFLTTGPCASVPY